MRIDTAPASQAPKATEYMVGGYEVKIPTGGFCSAGFNTVDSSNRAVVLTAGHCVTTAGTVSRNGYIVGTTRTASFPGNDYGTFWNSYPSYWQPTVSVSKYNGTFVNIRGSWNLPPVGATVCKSGRTTGYTCGTITALNQSVTYTGGIVVSGLVRHNACVEGGDSGGANISAGAYALGMTSGAAMTSTGKCLSKAGQAKTATLPAGLSQDGLECIEWLSLDCVAEDGPWHSSVEAKIDVKNRLSLNGVRQTTAWNGALLCAAEPQRLRVRNVAGDELTLILKQQCF